MTKLADSTREKLKTVSVATLTTCLFKRGLRNQLIQDVHPLNPGGRADGRRGLHAALHPGARGPQRALGAGGPGASAAQGGGGVPPGAVFVIDSRKDARAGSAGSILMPG